VSGLETSDQYHLSKNRLETLFDAIFAFAMTLLVTGFVIEPISESDAPVLLPAYIASMGPQFFLFLIAFFVLASFWLVHHRQFHFVQTIDPALVWITVMMPFTTNVSGDYPDVQVAVVLFHTNLFILGVLFFTHWWYLVNNPHLTSVQISEKDATNGLRRAMIAPFVSFLAMMYSFVSPSWSMAIYLLIPPLLYIYQRYLTIWKVS
jgi:uncharacterized membrane protein